MLAPCSVARAVLNCLITMIKVLPSSPTLYIYAMPKLHSLLLRVGRGWLHSRKLAAIQIQAFECI